MSITAKQGVAMNSDEFNALGDEEASALMEVMCDAAWPEYTDTCHTAEFWATQTPLLRQKMHYRLCRLN